MSVKTTTETATIIKMCSGCEKLQRRFDELVKELRRVEATNNPRRERAIDWSLI